MSKEFKVHKATTFLKTYLKSIAIIFPMSAVVIVRTKTSDLAFKDELIYAIIILLVSLIILGIFRFFSEKDKVFIIHENSLQIQKKNKVKNYEFTKLKRIKRTSKDLIQKTGMDVLELYFENEKKLKLTNGTPFYSDFKRYLKNTLINSGYYDKIIIENDL